MRVSFPDFFDGLIFWGVLNFFPIIFYLLGALGCKALVNIILCGPSNPHMYTLSLSRQMSNCTTEKEAQPIHISRKYTKIAKTAIDRLEKQPQHKLTHSQAISGL